MMNHKRFIFNQQFSNDMTISLQTILRALSCSLFILLLICLPWNINKRWTIFRFWFWFHKFFEKNTSFLKGTNLTTLVNVLSFLFAFKQIFDRCLSNLIYVVIYCNPKKSRIITFPDYILIELCQYIFSFSSSIESIDDICQN